MNDFQEPQDAQSLAGLVFIAATLGLAMPLYGYLLALSQVPSALRAELPSFPVAPLLGVVTLLIYLSPQLRRSPLPIRLLPLLLALGLARALPPRIPLVSPWIGLHVHQVYARAAEWPALAPAALWALGIAATIAFIPAAALRRRTSSEIAATAHGTARWAAPREIRSAGLLASPERGIHLGYLEPTHRTPITEPSDNHILVLAPPGTGKTTAIVIPTLLSYPATSWILDPKGELWEASAGWRQYKFGHECLRFEPTRAGTARWNPLEEIPLGEGDVAAATSFARNLVVAPAAGGAEQHWTLAARSLWSALALHVRYAPDLAPTMAALRGVLSSHSSHDDLFDELALYDHDRDLVRGWRDPWTEEPTATHPEVALLARKFRATPGRERGSIVSTLQQYLDPWGDPQIAAATERSDIDLADLMTGDPVTLYLSIPFHDLGRLSPLIRLQLAALGRRLTQRPPNTPHRLEVIIDEFASLGRLPIVEDLLAFLRGYAARATLLLQDLSQIRRLYGDRESITANCRVHLTTATQSPGTRRHTSSLAGTTTVRYRRTTRSRGGRLSAGNRRSSAMVETSRPLITEGEVGTLPLGRGVLFRAGLAPVRTHLLPYFEDPALLTRSGTPTGRLRETAS